MIKSTIDRLAEMRWTLRYQARVPTPRELRDVARQITAMTPAARVQSDSTEIIRAMRDRRLDERTEMVPPG